MLSPASSFARRPTWTRYGVSLGTVIAGWLAREAMHRARARALAELTERQRLEAELADLRQTFTRTMGSVGEISTVQDEPSRSPFFRPDVLTAKPAARLIVAMFLAAAALLVGT